VAIGGAFIVLALSIVIPYILAKFEVFFSNGELSLRLLDWACIGSGFLLLVSSTFRLYLFAHNPEREKLYKFTFLNADAEPTSRFARCHWEADKLIVASKFFRLVAGTAREMIFDCNIEVDVRTRHQFIVRVKLLWEKRVIETVFSNQADFLNTVRSQFIEKFGEERELAKIKAKLFGFRIEFGGLEFKLADVMANKGALQKRAPNWWKQMRGILPRRLSVEET
jgi:hypothetical protein